MITDWHRFVRASSVRFKYASFVFLNSHRFIVFTSFYCNIFSDIRRENHCRVGRADQTKVTEKGKKQQQQQQKNNGRLFGESVQSG